MQDEAAPNEDADRDWEGYYSYRAELERLRVGQVASFDSSIVNLASGALGLSVVLLTALAAIMKPVSLDILFAAWAAFVLCIVANLSSYQTGAKAAEMEIQALDAEMRGEARVSPKIWRKLTIALNRSVVVLFPSGAILLLLFAAFNAHAVSHRESGDYAIESTTSLPTTESE